MSDERKLEDLAEFIADGVDIDWGAERADCTNEQRATLDRLEVLDRMRRALDAPEHAVDPVESMTSWGHLNILERIGAGASSIVFRAHDPTLNREVALKLRTGGPSQPAQEAAWIEEARRLARVRHPNVVAVHGADVHDGVPGLWCDWVDGQTLGAETARTVPTDAELLDGAEALLSAVLAVHRQGLVHGDIKPDNVMCEADGRLLLMDFGAAARFDALHADDDRAGTPLAMAPERFRRARLSPAADVFGAGVVLFHWLEGRYPVVGTRVAAICDQWARGVRPKFRRRRGPAALRRLVLQMMAVDPSERPEPSDALRRIRRMRSAPLRRLRVGAATTVIVGLSLGLLVALSALHSADRAQRETLAVNEFLSDVLEAPRRSRLGPNLPMADLLDDSAARAEVLLAGQPAAQARVLGTIGSSFVSLQQYDRAGPLLDAAERLLTQQGRLLGAAEVRRARAELAMNQRRFDDARALHRRNLLEARGKDPRATALRVRSRLGLAQVELAAGRLDQAEPAVAAAFDELDAGHDVVGRETLRASIRLTAGELLLGAGRYEQARSSFEQALAHYSDRVGERNQNAAVARTGLIEAYDRLGRLDEAVALAERNVVINTEWLGPTDRLSIAARDALANIHSRQGDPERALLVNRSALDALAQAPSDDPLLVLQLEANQIGYLLDAGRPGTALRLSEDLLPRLVATIGAGHILTWITALNKADALLAESRPIEALALARDLDRRIRAQFGDAHLFARVAGYLIGGALSATGQMDAAEAALVEQHGALRNQLGEDHPLTLKAAWLLAVHLQRTDQTQEALKLAEAAARQAHVALGPKHQRTRDLDATLASLRSDEGAL